LPGLILRVYGDANSMHHTARSPHQPSIMLPSTMMLESLRAPERMTQSQRGSCSQGASATAATSPVTLALLAVAGGQEEEELRVCLPYTPTDRQTGTRARTHTQPLPGVMVVCLLAQHAGL
jgi:hypothetical protein